MPAFANAGRHIALVVVDASAGACRPVVVADLTLAAFFRQANVIAALQAAVAACSCDGRTVHCSAESAAAAVGVTHRQFQVWCACLCAIARKAKVLAQFTNAAGSWPLGWGVAAEIPFTYASSIRSGDMCLVADEPVQQIHALFDALASNAAQYAPSVEQLFARSECVASVRCQAVD